ncbi:hypothetical protein TCAL_15435 [Tigriopus californicus]|uniref:DUF5641 domain-containing protein n=1 Tax=Tigriopus californicus TaxID=6832 RepID=A0A553PRB6_TIGCA|nr:hypothetical protein TCAL_15435 [Tigriopus californicus]
MATADLFSYGGHDDNLKGLAIGNEVLVQDVKTKRWDKLATVLDTSGRRKYQLRFPSGRILWRNRRYIRQAPHGLQNESDLPLEPESKALRRSCREKRSLNYYTS